MVKSGKGLSSNQLSRLWKKLFPLKVGDRVRYIKNTTKEPGKRRLKMLNHIGRIIEEFGERYKKLLVEMQYYPESIMEEHCFSVKFPEHSDVRFTFREMELERVK